MAMVDGVAKEHDSTTSATVLIRWLLLSASSPVSPFAKLPL